MKAIYSVFFSLCVGLLLPTISSANSKTVGTVVKVSGSATILINGKSNPAGPKPRVSYEGRYYTEKKIRRGTKVRPGHIIRTTPQSSVKIIFSNGDHFLVGPSTSYLYSYRASKKGKEKKPTLDIYYGKLRALITKDKKNPRSDLRVKTKSAVAGIRGTDFYVSFHGSDGTQLKVMRGKVALKPILKVVKEAPEKTKEMRESKDSSEQTSSQSQNQESLVEEVEGKEVEVGTGSSVVIKSFESKKEAETKTKGMQNTKLEVVQSKEVESIPVAVTMAPITKEELLTVQSISVVKSEPQKKADDQASESTSTITQAETKELEVLEKKATQALVKDITNYTPEIMEKIKDTDKSDSEKINTAVLSNLYKQAPAEKPKSKPSKGEIDSIGQDIYDTYFNIEE